MLTFYMYTTDNHTATVAIMSKVSNVNDVKLQLSTGMVRIIVSKHLCANHSLFIAMTE